MLSLPLPSHAQNQQVPADGGETSDAVQRAIPAWLTGRVIDDLDAPDLATRDAAWLTIVDAPDISHAEILDVLARQYDTLSPEQKDRLLDAGEMRYLQRLAVIGIQMKTGVVPITIDKIFPDAPAAAVLKIDDQLLAINDIELPESGGGSVLQATITALEVGEQVSLDIVRDGKPMLVDVELANAFELENFTTLQQLISNRKRHWATIAKDVRPIPTKVPTKSVELVPKLHEENKEQNSGPSP